MFVFFLSIFYYKFIRAIYWPIVFFFVVVLPVLCIRVLLSSWEKFRSARSYFCSSSPPFPSPPSSSFCLLLLVLLLETGFHYVSLELCNPGTHIIVQVVLRLTEIQPASTSQLLVSKVCATIPGSLLLSASSSPPLPL